MKKCRAFFYAANASQQIAKTFRQSAPFAPLAWRNVVSICIQIGTITVDQYAIAKELISKIVIISDQAMKHRDTDFGGEGFNRVRRERLEIGQQSDPTTTRRTEIKFATA